MRSSLRSDLLRAVTVSILSICIGTGATSSSAFAQKGLEKVIYNFQGGSDGELPQAGLIADGDGNLYGTTLGSYTPTCSSECGTVFQLSPPATTGGTWTNSQLHLFAGGESDGSSPQASLVMDKNGNLFGTTYYGGAGSGGTVFELTPPTSSGEAWTEKILTQFPASGRLGLNPWGGLTFDADGNLYGTTYRGGNTACNCGTVFELFPPTTAGEGWTLTTIHRFGGGPIDGGNPFENLVFDRSGALYGTTANGGGYGVGGTIFQMKRHDGSWVERVIYKFLPTGNSFAAPEGSLIFDSAGNLYGTAFAGGSACDCGGIWELSPGSTGTAAWTYSVLYGFYVPTDADQTGGSNPLGSLVMDKAGNLYGTTFFGGLDRAHEEHDGVIFELSPPTSTGGTWTKTILHEFSGTRFGDGRQPMGDLIIVKGKFYGVTDLGGSADLGTVFSLVVTP